MGSPMTTQEIYDALVQRGVAHEKARRAAGFEHFGDETPATHFMQVIGSQLTFPIRFTLPWTALVSENRRFCAIKNRIFMTADYKAARAKVKVIALKAMQAPNGEQFQPLAIPLALHARVYFPDARIHDAPNFAGATHNALKKIVFKDDAWIYRAIWERAGVDPDAPRAEIEISALGDR